jgi:hypothetical protein
MSQYSLLMAAHPKQPTGILPFLLLLRGSACDASDHLHEWHHPRCVGPYTSASGLDSVQPSFFVDWVLQFCSPTPPSLGLLISSTMVFYGCTSLNVLLWPMVSSQRDWHLPCGLYWRSCFSSRGSPGTRSCEAIHHPQGSFQPHCHNSITLSHCYLTVALHTGGWMWSCSRVPQWHFLNDQSKQVAPQIHVCIMGVHDVKSQDDLICDIGKEHPSC